MQAKGIVSPLGAVLFFAALLNSASRGCGEGVNTVSMILIAG
jgi:hypothetical protein